MTEHALIRRRTGARMRALLLAAAFLSPAPLIMPGVSTSVQAQVAIRAEFREALSSYGQWERHFRWGEVWRPAHVSRSWRPYTVGHWAYTDDWGWYWVSDTAEDAWGWVVYHYGRWVYDDDEGWIWIPGDEWGPAWVSWRRGARYIGWEPLPPEEFVVEYSSRPDYWIFCRARDFIAPDIATVVVPVREYDVFFPQTVIVNRTYEFRNYGYAVNPGIAPTVVAAFAGRPVHTFEVRPVVLAGMVEARIPGAVAVRAQELRTRISEITRQAAAQRKLSHDRPDESSSAAATDRGRRTVPRSGRNPLSMSACATPAFSVAPSINASGCLMPSPSIPIASHLNSQE